MIMDAAIGNRKRQWFSDKVLPHEPFLRRYLQRLDSQVPDIDDLLQEIYARLLSLPDAEIERAREVGPLVSRTVHAIVLERLRSRRVVSLDAMVEMQSLPEIPASVWTDKQPDARQELALLRRVVASLPRRCRKVFVLSKVHGLQTEEIAVRLKVPQKKVEQQIATGVRVCAALLFTIAGGSSRSLLAHLLLHGTAR